jgi:hypothetical protein
VLVRSEKPIAMNATGTTPAGSKGYTDPILLVLLDIVPTDIGVVHGQIVPLEVNLLSVD